MIGTHRPRIAAGLAMAATAALSLAGGGDAQGQGAAKPTPTSCAGIAFTDPAGDQRIGGSPQKAKDNLDITSGFFRYAADASGDTTLTANLQITNLSKQLETGANAASWYVQYLVGPGTSFVSATVNQAGDITFNHGTLVGTTFSTAGETTGRFIEGKDGIISIVIPGDLGFDGETLKQPRASSRVTIKSPDVQGNSVSSLPVADSAPDSGGGKDFQVTPCAESGPGGNDGAGGGTDAAPAPTPKNDLPAGGSGSGSGSGGSGSGGSGSGSGAATAPSTAQPSAAAERIRLKVTAGKLSARKAKRAFAVRLSADRPVTALKATLYTGKASKPKVFATGSLARLNGNGKLSLRVKRKLKKGSYTLALTGRTASGAVGTVAVKLRFAR